jgi:hypothetical protein
MIARFSVEVPQSAVGINILGITGVCMAASNNRFPRSKKPNKIRRPMIPTPIKLVAMIILVKSDEEF